MILWYVYIIIKVLIDIWLNISYLCYGFVIMLFIVFKLLWMRVLWLFYVWWYVWLISIKVKDNFYINKSNNFVWKEMWGILNYLIIVLGR